MPDTTEENATTTTPAVVRGATFAAGLVCQAETGMRFEAQINGVSLCSIHGAIYVRERGGAIADLDSNKALELAGMFGALGRHLATKEKQEA